jgi:putative redox protein
VTWENDLIFTGMAESGYPVKMDSKSSPDTGLGPVEMVAIALAGCTAMDVISILTKKQQNVTTFDVRVHADRATEYPRVITQAALEYVVTGHAVDETDLIRAIDLSIKKYCPVYAMLKKAFPIVLRYSIFEEDGKGKQKLIKQGTYRD